MIRGTTPTLHFTVLDSVDLTQFADGWVSLSQGAKIIIGDDSGISNCAIFATEGVTIGKQVMIGAGVKIYDTDFHPVEFKERMENKPARKAAVTIADGAFIGAHSIILKGATIGKKSVIGAGSVVTGCVPDDEIWAGNPAKFIRKIEGEE